MTNEPGTLFSLLNYQVLAGPNQAVAQEDPVDRKLKQTPDLSRAQNSIVFSNRFALTPI